MFKKTPTEESEGVEVLEDNSKNMIMGIIGQLRKDMDLSRVALPTFVLEPRSMLEKITDFMSHPDLLLAAKAKQDPVERFVEIVRYFMSGWHVKPKGVKKPYNPVLGEFFRCQWQFSDTTKAYYIAEQMSHHPPISAYYFGSPENGIHIEGEIHPKARFLGNSVASMMQGYTRIHLEHHKEVYDITSPNVYARGILFGKMIMELGDRATIRCASTDLVCEVEFKTKGVFSGHYHGIVGKIKRESTQQVLYELSGTWNHQIFIHSPKKTNAQTTLFFDVKTASAPVLKHLDAEEDQEMRESKRLWSKVTAAIKANDMELARDEKQWIEDWQRQEAGTRQKQTMEWQPRFFIARGSHYCFKGSKTQVQNIHTHTLSFVDLLTFITGNSSSCLCFFL
ncbi:hypothetical protein BDF14DRAFT_1787736 [Spinellus fusiger]|nr:hypothetical protein BDF14DRAFT_1787736 [Spinellus fusiger]